MACAGEADCRHAMVCYRRRQTRMPVTSLAIMYTKSELNCSNVLGNLTGKMHVTFNAIFIIVRFPTANRTCRLYVYKKMSI